MEHSHKFDADNTRDAEMVPQYKYTCIDVYSIFFGRKENRKMYFEIRIVRIIQRNKGTVPYILHILHVLVCVVYVLLIHKYVPNAIIKKARG